MTPNGQEESLLIIAPSWVGDMVMSHTLIQILRQQNPAMTIDLLAPEWSLPLTQAMPEVRQAIPLAIPHGSLALRTRYRLAQQLKGRGYSRAVLLQNSFKSALLPFWAAIPQRIGYVGEWRWPLLTEARRLDKRRWPRTVDRFAALGLDATASLPDPLPRPVLTVNPQCVQQTLHQYELLKRPLLVLATGAEYGPSKQWPIDYFATVAQAMVQRGWQLCLIGSRRDASAGQRLVELAQVPLRNLIGLTTLQEAVEILSQADLVLTNDSGLMHVAAALNRPLGALFGSSDPKMTPPLSENAQLFYRALPCSPCFRRVCPLGHLRCLKEITPEEVLTALVPCYHNR